MDRTAAGRRSRAEIREIFTAQAVARRVCDRLRLSAAGRTGYAIAATDTIDQRTDQSGSVPQISPPICPGQKFPKLEYDPGRRPVTSSPLIRTTAATAIAAVSARATSPESDFAARRRQAPRVRCPNRPTRGRSLRLQANLRIRWSASVSRSRVGRAWLAVAEERGKGRSHRAQG